MHGFGEIFDSPLVVFCMVSQPGVLNPLSSTLRRPVLYVFLYSYAVTVPHVASSSFKRRIFKKRCTKYTVSESYQTWHPVFCIVNIVAGVEFIQQ